jgi:sulfur relay protein TusB/DsrH
MDTLIPIIKTQTSNGAKVGIVLIHDGAINASSKRKTSEQLKKLMELPIAVFVMVPDMKARGILLDSINNAVKPINYEDLVDILDSSEKIVSWM